MKRLFWILLINASAGICCFSEPAFELPTANRAIFQPGAEDKFFAPTPGKSWTSGTFGCVRSSGWQMHEGLDIRSIQRDRRGEPIDPVMAAADGTIAYFNNIPGLSNYGKYIVIRHSIDSLDVYSLYAHLSEIEPRVQVGAKVKAGEKIAVMGRTSNTRSRITLDRAHVHFEVNLFLSERFNAWYQQMFPNQRNDHGPWNGQNLLGLDTRLIFLEQARLGRKFSLVDFVRGQTELCRVQVRQASFPFLRRYYPLVRRNPAAERTGVSGYEIAINYNGVPIQMIPKTSSELKAGPKFELLSVNEAEYNKNPCRRLIAKGQGGWTLTNHGQKLFELLCY